MGSLSWPHSGKNRLFIRLFLPVSVSSSGHYWISVNWRTVISHNTKWVKIMHNSHITQFGLDNAHVQTQGKLVKWPDLISGFTNDWWKSDQQICCVVGVFFYSKKSRLWVSQNSDFQINKTLSPQIDFFWLDCPGRKYEWNGV